jgi:hypothetical protein
MRVSKSQPTSEILRVDDDRQAIRLDDGHAIYSGGKVKACQVTLRVHAL